MPQVKPARYEPLRPLLPLRSPPPNRHSPWGSSVGSTADHRQLAPGDHNSRGTGFLKALEEPLPQVWHTDARPRKGGRGGGGRFPPEFNVPQLCSPACSLPLRLHG